MNIVFGKLELHTSEELVDLFFDDTGGLYQTAANLIHKIHEKHKLINKTIIT